MFDCGVYLFLWDKRGHLILGLAGNGSEESVSITKG